MDSERRTKVGKRLGWVLALLALYVLSIGPVGRLVMAGFLNERVFVVLYAPLVFASRNSKLCENALTWYDSLWGPY
jgi:hypothetical protein